MNRRDLLKLVPTALGMGLVAKVATAEVPPAPMSYSAYFQTYTNPRLERYKKYEQMLRDNPKLLNDDMFLDMAKRVHSRVEFALGHEAIPPYLKLTPFKIGLIAFDLALYGDYFCEIVGPPVIDREFIETWGEEPDQDVTDWIWDQYKPVMFQQLPCKTVYRIETIKGKLVEFQQSHDGPDYTALTRCHVWKDDGKSTAVRFGEWQVVHIISRFVKPPRKVEFYPYGVSALEHYNEEFFENDLYEGILDIIGRFN